jgi:hypothetical protein
MAFHWMYKFEARALVEPARSSKMRFLKRYHEKALTKLKFIFLQDEVKRHSELESSYDRRAATLKIV